MNNIVNKIFTFFFNLIKKIFKIRHNTLCTKNYIEIYFHSDYKNRRTYLCSNVGLSINLIFSNSIDSIFATSNELVYLCNFVQIFVVPINKLHFKKSLTVDYNVNYEIKILHFVTPQQVNITIFCISFKEKLNNYVDTTFQNNKNFTNFMKKEINKFQLEVQSEMSHIIIVCMETTLIFDLFLKTIKNSIGNDFKICKNTISKNSIMILQKNMSHYSETININAVKIKIDKCKYSPYDICYLTHQNSYILEPLITDRTQSSTFLMQNLKPTENRKFGVNYLYRKFNSNKAQYTDHQNKILFKLIPRTETKQTCQIV